MEGSGSGSLIANWRLMFQALYSHVDTTYKDRTRNRVTIQTTAFFIGSE